MRGAVVPRGLILSPLSLAMISCILGFFPGFLEMMGKPLLQFSLLSEETVLDLRYWYGWKLDKLFVLFLSVLTLALGYLSFRNQESSVAY